jgi:hypothetical protein
VLLTSTQVRLKGKIDLLLGKRDLLFGYWLRAIDLDAGAFNLGFRL